MITTFTSVTATINNIGPGLEIVGPTGSFADFTVLSKWVFIFDMLAGRLELFPLLILFHPVLWKEQLSRRRMKKKK
jgi:trk system potassium uptake protein TrkH